MSEETTVPATADTTASTTEGATEATVVSDEGKTVSTTAYLDGKYTSVSALEEGYRELQSSYSKKLGAFDGSPEEYTLPEDKPEITELLTEWGKDNQLSQKGMDAFLEKYNAYDSTNKETQEAKVAEYKKAEMTKLGENADYRVKNATSWVQANLGEEGVDVLNNLGGAKGIEVVEKIMALAKGVSPTAAPAAVIPDKDKIRAMRFAKDEYGNRRMSSDPAYRAKVETLEAQLVG